MESTQQAASVPTLKEIKPGLYFKESGPLLECGATVMFKTCTAILPSKFIKMSANGSDFHIWAVPVDDVFFSISELINPDVDSELASVFMNSKPAEAA